MSSTQSDLLESYLTGSANIQRTFEVSGDGSTAVNERTALVDGIAIELFHSIASPDPRGPDGFCLVALGGFGRSVLFPYSDVDLLFLCEDSRIEDLYKNKIARVCRMLWDLRLRISPTTRRLSECKQLYRENLEFNISLLDCRYMTGDTTLFDRLHDDVVPQMVSRDREELVQNLAELTRQRHSNHGHTIFHLEPKIKDGPGGLRDYHVARWLSLIGHLEDHCTWPTAEGFPTSAPWQECAHAFEFLSSTRCFLHYRHGRDNNMLSYELQDEAAALGIGLQAGGPMSAADWMRHYFRHARSIQRMTTQLLDQVVPAHSSLYSMYEDWRSRLSTADFSVHQGRIFLRQAAALRDPVLMLELFEFMARHGLKLSGEAERYCQQALTQVQGTLPAFPDLWQSFRQILLLPQAAQALRAMHQLGVLAAFFPEFQIIDSLVIRDFYHRYTVDEHSFMTIECLHRLRNSEGELDKRYSEILAATEQPELLFLAMLFHDVGKGMAIDSHVEGSLQAMAAVLSRLQIGPAGAEAVQFLIANHLEMSATLLRRDIFDPETVRTFAAKVGTPEYLKMLCLFTFADIKSVNPEALTPWKAETLWQLYAATANHLSRNVDQDRLNTESFHSEQIESVQMLFSDAEDSIAVRGFLDGFPKRYLRMHLPGEVAEHYRMVRQMEKEGSVLRMEKPGDSYKLTLVTADRPFLFATITGALSAWGMNIIKADAFCNSAGTVLDTFYFTDLFCTLDLNASEAKRFKESIIDVLCAQESLETLLARRPAAKSSAPRKVKVETKVWLDDESSSHSTILELVTQDRPGLLHAINATIAELGCNIEVALIDTEGQRAIDIFYLTYKGAKLTRKRQQKLHEALLQQISME